MTWIWPKSPCSVDSASKLTSNSTLPAEFQRGKKFFCAHARKGLALPLKNRHNGCFLMACGNPKNVTDGYMALQARSGGGPCKVHCEILKGAEDVMLR